MKRLIINFPQEPASQLTIDRSLYVFNDYLKMGRDGKRITIIWENSNSLLIYHDNQKEPAIYSWKEA